MLKLCLYTAEPIVNDVTALVRRAQLQIEITSVAMTSEDWPARVVALVEQNPFTVIVLPGTWAGNGTKAYPHEITSRIQAGTLRVAIWGNIPDEPPLFPAFILDSRLQLPVLTGMLRHLTEAA